METTHDIEEIPSVKTFYKGWRKDFKHLKSPAQCRLGRCDVCCNFTEQIKIAKGKKREALMTKKKQHVHQCKLERVEMEALLKRAEDDPKEWTALATDWSAPHMIPHLARTPKTWLTKKRLKYQVFGICDYGNRNIILQPHFDFWPHDANLHISFLFTYLRELKEKGKLGKRLMLQMDNCWRDNKNKYLLGFLAELIAAKWFVNIEVYYLRPGHSHGIVDRACFKPLGRQTRFMYSYWTPEEFWSSFVTPAFRQKMIRVRQLEHLIVWDWKEWMENSLRNIHFHSFQRAFILENVDGQPTMKFKKNLFRKEWRGVKGGEEGLRILIHTHVGNEQPGVLPPTPLPTELTDDLLTLTSMLRNIQTFWESWLEDPFDILDHQTPEEWITDFWLQELNQESENTEETTLDEECFSTEERNIHVVHHPSVIPLIELTKGCIIAVRPEPAFYERYPDAEVEPFWLAQIIRQKTTRRSGIQTVHQLKVAWFDNVHYGTNAIPTYKLNEEDVGWIDYATILLHRLELTLHGQVRTANRRKLLRMMGAENE
jgi:hypothetical protein